MKNIICFLLVALFLFAGGAVLAQEEIRFDFESGLEGWEIPPFALEQTDHKGIGLEISSEEASTGENSLKLTVDFPGDIWRAALVDVEKDMDFSDYDTISVDVYLPKNAPKGLIQARIILTAGIGWHFIEMREAVILKPGKWTTVTAKIEKEEILETKDKEGPKSIWRGRKEKRLFHHVDKIKKIAVRIEYDAAPPFRLGPKYKGPVYIDNIVVK